MIVTPALSAGSIGGDTDIMDDDVEDVQLASLNKAERFLYLAGFTVNMCYVC